MGKKKVVQLEIDLHYSGDVRLRTQVNEWLVGSIVNGKLLLYDWPPGGGILSRASHTPGGATGIVLQRHTGDFKKPPIWITPKGLIRKLKRYSWMFVDPFSIEKVHDGRLLRVPYIFRKAYAQKEIEDQ